MLDTEFKHQIVHVLLVQQEPIALVCIKQVAIIVLTVDQEQEYFLIAQLPLTEYVLIVILGFMLRALMKLRV